ncbi:hypothetical protein ILUMI_26777 [Ignelater luminosus]|uniref:DDE Tnp4 domain-containing protein n=1 Tax=Ignelater luminosus TaxID=2038154 RepID=A0A8K0C5D0_IGNLU|nr:hypothetical protein ILUMI_26777 [Ignelater luminosus]
MRLSHFCTNLMRPFNKTRTGSMDEAERIFNYSLSRARRLIENTFDILVARFKIFHRVINAAPETENSIIEACVCLHNFIKTEDSSTYSNSNYIDREVDGGLILGEWRKDVPQTTAVQPSSSLFRSLGSRNQSNYIKHMV